MRKIDLIIVHCSATQKSMDIGVKEIEIWHKKQGFREIGYHYVIRLDGIIEEGRKHEDIGAHCKGMNSHSLGICLVGGIDKQGKAVKNFTHLQFKSLAKLLKELQEQYNITKIQGHREFAKKACPCFNVEKFCISQGIL